MTAQDVRAALGPQVDELMLDVDIDVEELIRRVNAETTVLPAIPTAPATDSDPGAEAYYQPELAEEEAEEELATATRLWKRRFLRGALAAVLLTLTGGAAAALAMSKNITVAVDGEEQTVRTFDGTVGEVLDRAEIDVGAHDAVSPAPQAAVADGGVITLERGRQLELVVDGEPRDTWVRASTVSDALEQLGLAEMLGNGAWTSQPAGSEVPLEGMSLEVKSLKTITLQDGGQDPQELSTHALTVQELLEELDAGLGSDDEVAGGLQRAVTDGAEIDITRNGTTEEEEIEEIEAPVEEVTDDDLDPGERDVVEEGSAGEEVVTYRVTHRNGEERDREELSSEVVTEPEPKVVHVGPEVSDSSTVPSVDEGGVWDRLAFCEATNDWSIDTGNGYYGGLQFDEPTWQEFGGHEHAQMPHHATREEQIDIATNVRDARGGYSAWPSCANQLGLPR